MSESSQDRLARLVLARREWLGLYREQVAAKGGPTAHTLVKIERAELREHSDRTYQRLERALEWAPGVIQRIRLGELCPIDEEQLVTGPVGVGSGGLDGQPAAQLLAAVSDRALLAELQRRLGSRESAKTLPPTS